MQHGSGAPSRASVTVVDCFTSEPLGYQNGLQKTRRIASELFGDGPLKTADTGDYGGHVAAADIGVRRGQRRLPELESRRKTPAHTWHITITPDGQRAELTGPPYEQTLASHLRVATLTALVHDRSPKL